MCVKPCFYPLHSCLQQSVLVMQAKAVAEQLQQFDIKKVYISPFYRYTLCRRNMLVHAVLWHQESTAQSMWCHMLSTADLTQVESSHNLGVVTNWHACQLKIQNILLGQACMATESEVTMQ